MRTAAVAPFVAYLFFLSVACFGNALHAESVGVGLHWLSDQHRSDGAVQGAGGMALDAQATAEVGLLAREIVVPGFSASAVLSFLQTGLQGVDFPQTEFLARAIRLGVVEDGNGNDLVDLLLAAQNEDGGFGDNPGYQSTAYDTAFALAALNAVAGESAAADRAVTFLVSRQHVDGSWRQGGNPDTAVTALVTAAVWHHRHRFQAVPAAVQSGMQYLLSRRQGDLWENDARSALALLALLPGSVSPQALSASVAALSARQRMDGSWGGDVYNTALVLRALLLAAKPVANPDMVRIHGRLVDGDTGLPLGGVTVTLGDVATDSVASDGQGRFLFAGLGAGRYTITIQHTGYADIVWEGVLPPGADLDLGDIPMTRAATGSTAAYLQGRVTDAGTGLPLGGALVAVQGSSLSAITDGDGRYLIPGLAAGQVTVSASHQGYLSRTGAGQVGAGQVLLFSPALHPLGEQPVGQQTALMGMVAEGRSGPAMPGVMVAVTAGGQVFIQQTDAEGRFLFADLPPGLARVSIQEQGYFDYEADMDLYADIGVDLGRIELIHMSREYGFTGLVLDSVTNEPLQGVRVRVVSAGTDTEIITDADGRYSLHPLGDGDVNLTFEKEDYVTSGTLALLDPGDITDLGQVRLRYEGFADLLTDLVVSAVDSREARSDPATLAVSGILRATIHNRGASEVRKPFDIVAFHDANGDGRLDVGDIPLGVTRFDPPLGGGADVAIALNGMLPFRDAPISVMVDAGSEVVESDRSNNVRKYSCDKSCVLLGEAFDGHHPDDWFDIPNHQGHNHGFTVAGGVYQSGGSGGAVHTGDQGWKNYSVETAIHFPDGASEFAGLLFRYQDPDNWYQLRVRNNTVQLVARLGGNPVQVLRSASASVAAGQWYRLRVRVQDAVARAYLNDQWLFEYTGLSLAEGAVGYAQDGVQVQFDNLQVDTCTSEFSMALKWHWRGAPGTVADTYGPVMVAQLTDDNGDGVIDSRDIPDLVFHTTANHLVAVSGDTGETLWVNTSVAVSGLASPAVADLDGDGLVEILSIASNRGHIHVFDHTGSLKRSIPAGPVFSNPRDAITIADLDQDGSPEIIHGRRVYAADGRFLWEGSGDHGGETGYGILSIAADIDLSGTLEVIAGGTAYNANGTIKWRQNSIGSGFNAIGNFDDDDYPEIIVVSSGRLFLLEHTGEIIWGPVLIGGGTGGPPTVADVDGDGIPDIGVAGSQYFSVFASDGSLKWRQPISDFSSARTGSSVFDFQADGRAELVYADEQFLRVYDGATGTVLAQVPNSSGTTLEYPVIADIDNSGSASIVVGANGGPAGERGVKAYGSANNDWVGTRGIWNQHAYHIDNINDDGSVPRLVQPSWLEHNTYRLNRFPGAGSREVHDLTLSLLTPIDNGAGHPLSVSVRIGNAGSLPSPATTVAIHRGSLSGPLLGTAQIGPLQPDTYVDVQVNGLQGVSRHDSLVAVVNPEGRLAECSGGNNIQSIAVNAALGAVSLATDSGSYAPGATVLIDTTVVNVGMFDADYLLHWWVEDADGNLVADLGQTTLSGVQSGESDTLGRSWNTAGVIAGDYRIAVSLYAPQGDELARDTIGFAVSAVDAGGGPATVGVNIASDKSLYQAWDMVHFSGHVKNNAVNFPLADSVVELTVRSPSGQQVLLERWNVPGLAAQALQQLEARLDLADNPAGLYQVRLDVHTVEGDNPLASATTTFAVERTPLQSLVGVTTATPSVVQRGAGVSCSHSATNRSAFETVQVDLQYLLLKPASEEVISRTTDSMALAPGQTHSHIRRIDTAGLDAGGYSCLQQAVLSGETAPGGESIPVSQAGFSVSTPPVELDGGAGGKGRLLILFDGPARGCPKIKGGELLGHFGRKFHLWDIWSIKSCWHAGSVEAFLAPELQQRLDYLMALLVDAGYSFTVVFNATDFEKELFSGDYHGYVLNQQKFTLPGSTETILGEAVNRGAGLLASAASTRRNGAVERALGISTTGLELAAHGVRIPEGALGDDWQAVTTRSRGGMQDFDSCGAQTLATYVNPWKHWLALRSCPNFFGTHPAATHQRYGAGKGIYLGFDGIAEAAWADIDNDGAIHEALLRYSLEHIQPEDFPLRTGLVVPVTFTISGAVAETEVELYALLPDNLQLVDASLDFLPVDGQYDTEQRKAWQEVEVLAAGEELVVTLYVKLLDDSPGTVTLQVWSGSGGDGLPSAEFSHDLEPEPASDYLADAIAMLEILNRERYRINISLALGHVRVAASRRDAGRLDAAIDEILKALHRLVSENSPSAQQARRLLDDELFSLLARSTNP